MTGTYSIKLHTGKNDYETNTLILLQKEDKLEGLIAEVLFRPVDIHDGQIDGDNFVFNVPPFITIYGDFAMRIEGTIKDGKISGKFMTLLGIIPFDGVKVSDMAPYLH